MPAPSIDLSRCAREQIHAPGAVQDFGVLLVLCVRTLDIEQASANAIALLGVPADRLVGSSLEQWLSPEDAAAIATTARTTSGDATTRRLCFRAPAGRRGFEATLHPRGAKVLIELEPEDASDIQPASELLLPQALTALQRSAGVQDLCDASAAWIRRITGYHRVMVYRFAPDWSGEVVAEDVEAGHESFLGLHYPASDIPQQARELYLRNPMRVIADVEFTPAPLIRGPAAETGPLDMSLSSLRVPAPTHLEYLKNMRVRATLVLSLVREGRLWGLIICHHHAPHRPPPRLRASCLVLARLLSLELPAKELEDQRQQADRHAVTITELLARVDREADLGAALLDERPNLRDLIPCGGAAVVTGGHASCVGSTPPEPVVIEIARRASREPMRDWQTTDRLCETLPDLAPHAATASGVLAVRLGGENDAMLVWFRPEMVRTLRWGGDPYAPAIPSANGGMPSPRKSFAAWMEQVRGRSAPWEPAEVEAARRLGAGVRDRLLARASEWARINAELERTNAGLRAALDALRETEARLHAVFDNMPMLFWVCDGAGRCVIQNDACRAAWGDIAGKRLQHAGLNPEMVKHILPAQRLAAGGEVVNEEVRCERGEQPCWFQLIVAPVRLAGKGLGAVGVAIDISDRKRAEARQRIMSSELDHRVRNTLAAVISLIHQSAAGATSVEAFAESVTGRVRAMARAHNLLSAGAFEGAGLRQALAMALEAHLIGEPPRIVLAGPDLRLPKHAVSPLVFALHELAINASKHGALTVPEGRVALHWRVVGAPDGKSVLHLQWEERGGPPTSPPPSKGFGMTLIEGLIGHEAGGRVKFDFAHAGAACDVELPLSEQ